MKMFVLSCKFIDKNKRILNTLLVVRVRGRRPCENHLSPFILYMFVLSNRLFT